MNDCEVLSPEMSDFSQFLEAQAYTNKIPLHGTFELTARCNFNCNMCYVHLKEEQIRKQGRELTNEEWLAIARQAKEAGMLYLTLTGGEVFTRPGFKELYLALSEMGFLIQILSNGYCVNESVLEWLQKAPPYTIRFTLYGASNATYENVCGIKDGFDKVSHAIDLVKRAKIPFYMVGTLVKENYHEFEAMCQFAGEKQVVFKATTAVLKSIRGVERDIEAHRLGIVEAHELPMRKREKVESIYPRLTNLLDVCGSYRKGFWITWDGNVQLCAFMKRPMISIRENSFLETWDKLLCELENLQMPSACSSCKYSRFCFRCPGILAAECGDCNQVTEEFCKRAKLTFQTYCEECGGEEDEENIC